MLKSPSVLKEVNAVIGSSCRTLRQQRRRARDVAFGGAALTART
jgi:hypothetical protein